MMKSKWSWMLLSVFLMWSCVAPGPTDPGSQALTAGHEEAERWAQETLSGLTLEEKVAQMICEQMRGEFISDDDEMFQYWSKLVRDHGIGAFVVYGGTPYDTAHLVNRLQAQAKIPLLITADFEGGPGQQFAGASEFPANMALSAIDSEELAYEMGKAGASEGRAIGIHVTYSPVVDVQTQPENPVLSVRSFGGDIEQLGRMAGAYIRGYQENGMLTTAKHYPGRGDVVLIPGTEYTINHKPAEQVEQEDFLAFQKAIDAGVTYIMTEHISVPSVAEGSELPASVEKKLTGDWLRDRLGFEGIITSDDIWYDKVVERFGDEKVGILAIQAGHDALLKPKNAIKMIAAVAEAVKAGEIPEEQIDASVKRILYWKARLNLHNNRFVDLERVSSVVGTQAHQDLVHQIAERSLTLHENKDFFPTDADKLGKIVHVSIQKNDNQPAVFEVAAKLRAALPVEQTFHIRPNVDSSLYTHALEAARQADTVVVSLFHPRTVYVDNGALNEKDLAFVRRLIQAKPQATVVMSYGNPYLAANLTEATAFVIGYGEGGFYGNQVVYADAFIRLLKGEIEAEGKLPVKLGSGVKR
jgi:beta-glucosidase-like glycosyl hydrolase